MHAQKDRHPKNKRKFTKTKKGGSLNHSHEATITTNVANHILTINQIPSHNHNNGRFQYVLEVSGSGTVKDIDNSWEPQLTSFAALLSQGGNQGHNHEATSYANINQRNHLPPYISICYIMRTTNSPTNAPSLPPTLYPTMTPTNIPSISPSLIPSVPPTNQPTPPSNAPTIVPTNSPSLPPTSAPSYAPVLPPTSYAI